MGKNDKKSGLEHNTCLQNQPADTSRPTDAANHIRSGNSLIDASHLHNLTEELRRERDRLQGYMDTVETIIVALDNRGMITSMNKKGCRLLGYSREELIGRSWFETCLPQPDGLEKVYPIFLEMMDGRIEAAEYFQNPVITKTGEIRYIAWHNSLLKDDQGRLAGTLSSGDDITEHRQTEQTLRETVTLLTQAEHVGKMGSWSADLDENITVSDEMRAIMGFVKDEAITGERIRMRTHPDDRDTVLLRVREAVEKGSSILEHRIVLPDGTVRHIWSNIKAVLDSQGKTVSLYGAIQDITERKLADEALRTSEAKYRHLFDNAVVGMYRSKIDGSAFLEVNQALCDIFGLTREELLSGPPTARWADPQVRSDLIDGLKQTGSITNQEVDFLDKNGKVLKCLISMKLYPEEGYLEGTTIDITARRTAEEALRENEQYLRTILQTTAEGFLVIDATGRILEANKAYSDMSGYAREELIGLDLHSIDAGDTAESRTARGNRVKVTGSELFETWHRRKDGASVPVEVSVTFIDVQGGQFIAFCRDLTERRRTEKKLRESEEQYRALVESSPDIIMRFDKDGRHLFASENVKNITGIPAADFFGKSHRDMGLPESMCDFWEECIRRVFGNGAPYETEFTFESPKGSIIFNWRIVPEIDTAGNVQSVLSISRDVTSQRKIEEDYRTLFNKMLNSVTRGEIICDERGRPVNYKVLAVNPAFEQMSGIKAQDIVGKNILDIFPDMDPFWIETLGGVALTGEPAHFERSMPSIGKIYEISVFRFAPNQFASFFQDITDRKLYEKKLQDTLVKLGAAQAVAKIGFWDLDLITMNLEWSEGVRSIFDLEPDNPTPSFDDFWSYVFSQDREFVKRQVQTQLTPMDRLSITYEYRILTKKGRLKCLNHTGRQEFDQDGKLIRIYGSVQDITERKQVEEALRVSETRYKAQYQGSPIPAFTWQNYGDDFVLVSYNDAARKITAGRVSDFIGSTAIQMYESYPLIVNNISRCYNEKTIIRDEVTSQHFLPGRQIKTTYAFVPPDFVLMHIEDLTEQRNAEAEKEKLLEQLLQAQKLEAIGRLAGGVAHDFNNMLAVITGHAELVLDQIDPATPPYADIQAIRGATEHSANLVRQLLAFARKQTIAPRVVNLTVAVQGIFNMLKRLIGENIDLVLQPQPDLYNVRIDPGQLDQILINLCINARDAIPQSGKITIETRNLPYDEIKPVCRKEMPPGEYVLLMVADNGCGMDAATLGKIFDPFFTTKEIGKGSGLGLSTVYGIVSQNNGCIHAESAPGHGTAFYIHLPRYSGEEEKSPVSAAPAQPQTGRETILLVEDESSLLKMTETMLRRLGYSVLSALRPEEAVRLATEHQGDIHLLIADVIMPHMNGRELADKLISIRPELRCLFMSGYTADVIAKKGILEKGVHFIQKPFQKKDLAAKVRETLDNV